MYLYNLNDMIRNKNLYLRIFLLVLLIVLASPAQLWAIDQKSYFSVTKFDLKNTSPEEAAKKKKENSPLNKDLIYRVAFGRVDDVKLLLQQGADPDAKNAVGLPVVVIATIRKDEDAPKILSALLKGGANVNATEPNGNVAVVEAVKGGRPDVLQILIDNHAVLSFAHDPNGIDLRTMAEKRGNLDILDIVNAGLDREKDQIEALRSKENFINLVQQYSFLNCSSEYLNFYIANQPAGVNMVEFNKVITGNTNEIADIARKIKLIFKMADSELDQIQLTSRRSIVQNLQYYQTNQNRELNGIGTDQDLNTRCWKIAKNWNARNLNQDQYKINLQ